MTEIEEIKKGIQQKRIDREAGTKTMWEDVAKKRKEIKKYIKEHSK